MFKNFRDKIALSGITVLMIGVALLIGTFVSAYGFLTQSLSIIASQDLVETFGEALAPLIATCIRIMYLGVMGWIGSLLTIRGVTLIAHTPQMPTVAPQKQIPPQQKPLPLPQKAKTEKPPEEAKPEIKPEVAKPETKPEETKPEAKPPEPEIVVIPPEQISQPQPEPKEPQKNDSPPQPPNQ